MARSLPAATSSRQLEAARKLTPSPAITKRFIISVESSSMEIRSSLFHRFQPLVEPRARFPLLGQQQVKLHNVMRLDRLPARQRVSGRDDGADLVLVNIHHLQPLLVHRKLRQSEVGRVFRHRFHHARGVRTVHLQLHGREQLPVNRKNRAAECRYRWPHWPRSPVRREGWSPALQWRPARGAAAPASARRARRRCGPPW